MCEAMMTIELKTKSETPHYPLQNYVIIMVVWSKCEHDFCCLESRAPNRLQSFENGEFGVCGELCDERRSLSAEWVIDDDDDGLNKRQTCLHYSFI